MHTLYPYEFPLHPLAPHPPPSQSFLPSLGTKVRSLLVRPHKIFTLQLPISPAGLCAHRTEMHLTSLNFVAKVVIFREERRTQDTVWS